MIIIDSNFKNFRDFSGAIINEMAKLARPEMQERKNETEEIITNHLFDLEGPKKLDREYSPNEVFMGKLFYGFVEIYNSFEVLLDLPVLISRFPYSSTRITRVRFLRHNIEGFLNEVYLLKERMIKYTKIIERYYREESIKHLCINLRDIVETTLKPIILQRGVHVHQVRYSDDKLEQLEMLELLSKSEEASSFTYYYDQKYKEVRREWRTKIDGNNNEIKGLLDHYFNKLYDYIFDINGLIKFK